MTTNFEGHILESESMGDLLTSAKKLLLRHGNKTESQRGTTFSLNNVLLTWKNPKLEIDRYSFRTKKEDLWYQNIFVQKKLSNLPERLAKPGETLFPYRYAQRGRYYDTGLGYSLAVAKAIKIIGGKVETHLKDITHFQLWLCQLGKYVHIQTILAVFLWWGSLKKLNFWVKNIPLFEELKDSSRIDPLKKIAEEVKKTSETRRAITPSFMYAMDYLLDPMMGVPPYQNFQLLPGKSNESLSSLHWHRSLDASGGAQLDFNHDFDWLTFASEVSGRKMGNISIITGNLHLYAPEETDNVKDWLNRVTDGYVPDDDILMGLLRKDVYVKNTRRVFNTLNK